MLLRVMVEADSSEVFKRLLDRHMSVQRMIWITCRGDWIGIMFSRNGVDQRACSSVLYYSMFHVNVFSVTGA